MQQQNAILAINSLDRYITNKTNAFRDFDASWLSGATTLEWEAVGDTPIIGSVFRGPLGEGIPVGTTITNWDPVTNTITIDKTTTAPSSPVPPGPDPVRTVWVLEYTTSAYNDFLLNAYGVAVPYSNSFTLQSQTNYIYGYIKKIIVSQIQLQYNVPTVNLNLNDTFCIVEDLDRDNYFKLKIPYGFYWPDELAAAMQQLIRNSTPWTDMIVTFNSKGGFTFEAGPNYPNEFLFPTPYDLEFDYLESQQVIRNVLKTYRMIGINLENKTGSTEQNSSQYPNFLYTPYIDIYSDTLTNYQTMKDTNTTIANQKGLIARVYLSGTGNIQDIEEQSALGSRAFTMTSDLNSPKVIEWTPDVTVTQIDIQLKDQYGELLPGPEQGYQTEFQITLLCSE